MRAPNGGASPSFCTMTLSHGFPATMILMPEFVPPLRRDSYEPRLNPDVVPAEWHPHPPGERASSGRMFFANETVVIGSLSAHLPVAGAVPPSGLEPSSSGNCRRPTSGSYMTSQA